MGPIASLSDLFSMLRRRASVIAAVFAIGILATLWQAMSIPATFQASAVVQLRSGAVAVEGEATQPTRRLQLIEQRLMSRGNILKLIERHELFADNPGMSEDQKVGVFRANTQIQMINAAGGALREGDSAPVTALIVTSRAGDAQTAAALVNDLTDSLIDQDREERLSSTEAAMRFLRSEQERLNRRIQQIDDEIGRVKKESEESLPGASEAIRSEQAQLRTTLMDLEQRELQLAREQLALELRAWSPEAETREATLAARLSKLSSELAQSRRLLPANHPEIKRLEQEIVDLRQNPAEMPSQTGTEREIALIDQQRASLDQQRREIETRQAEIATALDVAPVIEQRLTSMGREQAQLSAQLSSIALQLSQTESQRQLQDSAQAGRMEVLERAEPPRYPLSSSRRKIAAMGGMASLFAAFAGAFLLELNRPVMRTAAQVERALGVAPIAVAVSPGSARQRRRDALNYLLFVAIIAATLVAGMQIINSNRTTADTVQAQP